MILVWTTIVRAGSKPAQFQGRFGTCPYQLDQTLIMAEIDAVIDAMRTVNKEMAERLAEWAEASKYTKIGNLVIGTEKYQKGKSDG